MLDPADQVQVGAFAAIRGGIAWAVLLVAPGLAWIRLWPRNSLPCSAIVWLARVVLLGVVIHLLTALALVNWGVFRAPQHLMLIAVVTALGFCLTRRKPADLGFGARVMAICAFIAASAGIQLLPRRGEWVLGGWDPGIYLNQGVALARWGKWWPDPDPFYRELATDELNLFTRMRENYLEAFPVVPLDPVRRRLEPFFFQGLPTWIALLQRYAGLRAATRVNDFTALLALLFFAAAQMAGQPRRIPWAAFALLAQPLWLYHTHFPTAEMLQLALLAGLMLVAAEEERRTTQRLIIAALLFLAVVNRFSFLPFGALWVFLAKLEQSARQREITDGVALPLASLALGAALGFWANPTCLGRIYPTICALVAAFVVLALACAAPSRWIPRAGLRWVTVAAILATAAVTVVGLATPQLPFSRAVQALADFNGRAWLIWCALGVGALLLGVSTNRTQMWVGFLAISTLVTLLNPEITRIWPWATRRFVEFAVPLIALLTVAGTDAIVARIGTKAAGFLSALALVPAVVHAPLAWRSWSATEHDGATRILAAVAQRIEDRDIVVADHFRWGTPLRFIYDRAVINGELYLAPDSKERFRKALAVLARARSRGRRIRFLTSTEKGLEVFSWVPRDAALDWVSAEWTDSEVIHSERARQVRLRSKTRQFQLYTWTGAPDEAQNWK